MLSLKSYNRLLVFTVFAFNSGLNITSQLSVFVLSNFFLIAFISIAILFGSGSLRIKEEGNTGKAIGLFLLVTFYTMLIRGVGFEMLGSGKSGGMFYVKLFLVLFLYLAVLKHITSDKLVQSMVVAFSISTILPFISDLVFLAAGEETLFNLLVAGSTTIAFYASNEANSLLRIQSAAPVAESLMCLLLVYFPLFTSHGKLNLNKNNFLLLLAILVLTGLSGHRITLVACTLLVMFFYGRAYGPRRLVKPILLGSVTALMICVLVIFQYNNLPANFQRTFSFLPFIPKTDITLEASDSLNFRLLMAAKAMVMLPEYLLVGKGFAFYNYAVSLDDYFGIIDFFAEIGVFHNGVLGLVVNLGLPGLVVGLGLLYSFFKDTRRMPVQSADSTINRVYLVLQAKICLLIVSFIFLYGDVQTNFIELVVVAIMYKVARYHYSKQKAEVLN